MPILSSFFSNCFGSNDSNTKTLTQPLLAVTQSAPATQQTPNGDNDGCGNCLAQCFQPLTDFFDTEVDHEGRNSEWSTANQNYGPTDCKMN
jgi:hypothetical protein